MTQFVCQCLNITINGTVSKQLETVDSSEFPLPPLLLDDPFFQSSLLEVLSNSCTVIMSQPNLCSKRQVGKFFITSCLCCNQHTHATSSSNDKVLINSDLERDPVKIKELKESENYSKLYKLILPSSAGSLPVYSSSFDLKQAKNYQLSNVTQSIWQQATNFLCQEQKEMDERIRQFTEKEYVEYNNLQSQVMREKQILISMLQSLTIGGFPISLPLTLGQFPSPPTTPDNSEKTPYNNSFPKTELLKTVVQVAASGLASNIMKHQKEQNVNPRRRAQSIHSTSYDTNTIFDMDGLDDSEAPFAVSDEEDTDDSTVDEGMGSSRKPVKGMSKSQPYASSLPITVPLWSAFNHPDLSDEEEPKKPSPDPQHIAASFQALAMSSRDEKEMFGDLPRRRLNTGDLVNSRVSRPL